MILIKENINNIEEFNYLIIDIKEIYNDITRYRK